MMIIINEERQSSVMLSGAKHLRVHRDRSFAALWMTEPGLIVKNHNHAPTEQISWGLASAQHTAGHARDATTFCLTGCLD